MLSLCIVISYPAIGEQKKCVCIFDMQSIGDIEFFIIGAMASFNIAVLLWSSFVNARYFRIEIIQEMIHPGDLFTTGAAEFFTPVGLYGDMAFDVE